MLTGAGIAELEEQIAQLVLAGKTLQGEGQVSITSARHQESLRRASEHIRASAYSSSLRDCLWISFRLIYAPPMMPWVKSPAKRPAKIYWKEIFQEFCIGK